MKEHILVTGCSGFIGSAIVKSLLDAGYVVSSVSRNSGKSKHSFSVDLTASSEVYEFIKKSKPIDVVIHCAAIAHGETPPKSYTVSEFNSAMINNLVSAFSEKQPHWIFLSSISVYGDSYLKSLIPMEELPLPSDSYGKGKLCDENSLIKACNHLDILRLMPVFNSYENKDIKKRIFIPKTGIKLRILPSPLYSFCHINTLIEKVVGCLGETSRLRLHQVGDPLPTSQGDLIKAFPGPSFTIPQIFFKFLLFLLPHKFGLFRKIRFMIKKLGLSNTYELGVRELKKH
jgi:nucleoside-diphosphate-sugar epimerase